MGVLEAFYFLFEEMESFDDERGVWFRIGEVGEGEGEGEGGWMDKWKRLFEVCVEGVLCTLGE